MSQHGTISEVIASHPSGADAHDTLHRLLETIHACAAACTACADACLAEENVADMRACIRIDLDCADICAVTGRVAARQTELNLEILRTLLRGCETACGICGAECERHASKMDHCRICMEACRRCEEACRDFMG